MQKRTYILKKFAKKMYKTAAKAFFDYKTAMQTAAFDIGKLIYQNKSMEEVKRVIKRMETILQQKKLENMQQLYQYLSNVNVERSKDVDYTIERRFLFHTLNQNLFNIQVGFRDLLNDIVEDHYQSNRTKGYTSSFLAAINPGYNKGWLESAINPGRWNIQRGSDIPKVIFAFNPDKFKFDPNLSMQFGITTESMKKLNKRWKTPNEFIKRNLKANINMTGNMFGQALLKESNERGGDYEINMENIMSHSQFNQYLNDIVDATNNLVQNENEYQSPEPQSPQIMFNQNLMNSGMTTVRKLFDTTETNENTLGSPVAGGQQTTLNFRRRLNIQPAHIEQIQESQNESNINLFQDSDEVEDIMEGHNQPIAGNEDMLGSPHPTIFSQSERKIFEPSTPGEMRFLVPKINRGYYDFSQSAGGGLHFTDRNEFELKKWNELEPIEQLREIEKEFPDRNLQNQLNRIRQHQQNQREQQNRDLFANLPFFRGPIQQARPQPQQPQQPLQQQRVQAPMGNIAPIGQNIRGAQRIANINQ